MSNANYHEPLAAKSKQCLPHNEQDSPVQLELEIIAIRKRIVQLRRAQRAEILSRTQDFDALELEIDLIVKRVHQLQEQVNHENPR